MTQILDQMILANTMQVHTGLSTLEEKMVHPQISIEWIAIVLMMTHSIQSLLCLTKEMIIALASGKEAIIIPIVKMSTLDS